MRRRIGGPGRKLDAAMLVAHEPVGRAGGRAGHRLRLAAIGREGLEPGIADRQAGLIDADDAGLDEE